MADETKQIYDSREWHTGEVITADALNKIENEMGYVSAEVTNAVTGTINDQKLNDTIARKLDSIVKYFPEEPTKENLEYVRMYVQPAEDNGEIEVPTYEEFTSLSNSVSAITEQTRNLITGKIAGALIDEGGVIASYQVYDMWYAPIESGKTYTVTTNDHSGFVYGIFTSVPAIGSTSSTNGRVVDPSNKTFTASASGYIAFRSMAGYEQAQIEEGSSATSYIQPLTAVDIWERNRADVLLNREFYTLGQGITPTRIASFAGFDVFADMNNVGTGLFRNNSVYRYADFGSSDVVAHAPVTPFNGYLLTFGELATTTIYQQMAITNSGVVFVRNSTSDWRRNIDLSEFNSFLSEKNFIKGFQTGLTPERIAQGAAYAAYNDLNNIGLAEAPSNSIIRYANFNTPDLIAHSPISVFNGIVLSVSPKNVYSEVMQIAMDVNGLLATRYLRRDSDLTYPWHIIDKPVYEISNATALFNLLQTITTGVIHLREFEYDLYTGLYENLITAGNTNRHFIDGDVEIIGAGTRLKLHIPQAVVEAEEANLAAANVTSILDIRGNIKVTGVIFDCENTRYCVHYEANEYRSAFHKNIIFEDCEFHYNKTTSQFLNANSVGIGGSLGQNFTFRNCIFTNGVNKANIYIHTRNWAIGSLNIENCIFDKGVNLSQYTGTDAPIPVYFVNSKVGPVNITTQTNGLTDMQWKVTYINSKYTQNIGSGSRLLYEPTVFNITAQ